jgi:hypothetical protein
MLVLLRSQPIGILLLVAACAPPERAGLSNIIVGRCELIGPNSRLPECREYRGGWSEVDAARDCRQATGAFTPSACPTVEALGECRLTESPAQTRVVIQSEDTSQCALSRTGCEVFGGGQWVPTPRCGGVADEGLVVETDPFPQHTLTCKAPRAGEPAGRSDGGLVCTWDGMHGATEEGRQFVDYASCDAALKQRAYAPVPPDPFFETVDPRRADAGYLAEEAWVRSQIRAQACVCCHSNAVPSGGAVFGVDRPGSLANQFGPSGLAQGAGWKSTVALGAFPAAVNNGFQKSEPGAESLSIFMSTDPQRMKRFFERELEFRGITRELVATLPDTIAPLTQALAFRPAPCTSGEGLSADGTFTWLPGRARYLYVLEADAISPAVPPNLDLPAGTLWRVDVPREGAPVRSGTVRYGVLPEGLVQRFPASGAPAPLVSGRRYYLAAFADVLLPLSRCTFVAP